MAQEEFDAAIVRLMFTRFAEGHDAQGSDRDAERIVRSRHADFDFVAVRNGACAPRSVRILARFEETQRRRRWPGRPGGHKRGRAKWSPPTARGQVPEERNGSSSPHNNGE